MDNQPATTKRRYNKISAEHLAYARSRFADLASTSAALHYHWRAAQKARAA